ncbi:unnamed protein product, partial [Ectocarpus sp. 8 AP-2014]
MGNLVPEFLPKPVHGPGTNRRLFLFLCSWLPRSYFVLLVLHIRARPDRKVPAKSSNLAVLRSLENSSHKGGNAVYYTQESCTAICERRVNGNS